MIKDYYNCLKGSKILLVEDDAGMAALMELTINNETANSAFITKASSLKDSFDKQRSVAADVVLLDLNLPDSRGIDTLKSFSREFPNVPIIVLTALVNPAFALSIVEEGAQDYILKEKLDASMLIRSMYYSIERNRMYEELKNSREALKTSYLKLVTISDGVITALEKIVEGRDPYTAGHQKRVAELARAIGIKLKMPDDFVNSIYMGGMLHDIGKINVPENILNKPGKLTENEFDIIKTHPKSGYDILKTIDFPWRIENMALQHHERLDGSGYPKGLAKEDIIMESKIIGVADVVEAMSLDRPYRKAFGVKFALEEVERYKGTKFDKAVVEACAALFAEKEFKFEDYTIEL